MSSKQQTVSFPQTPSVSSANWVASGNFTPTYQYGWICPKCGAVMSPTTSICINCNGHTLPSWTTTTPFPPYAVPCVNVTDGTSPAHVDGIKKDTISAVGTKATPADGVQTDTITAVGTLETEPGEIYDHLTFAKTQTRDGDAPKAYYKTTSTLRENNL